MIEKRKHETETVAGRNETENHRHTVKPRNGAMTESWTNTIDKDRKRQR